MFVQERHRIDNYPVGINRLDHVFDIGLRPLDARPVRVILVANYVIGNAERTGNART